MMLSRAIDKGAIDRTFQVQMGMSTNGMRAAATPTAAIEL